MTYYLVVFIGAILTTLGLIIIKKPFFNLALSTPKLLNIVLNTSSLSEDEKQKLLVKNVGKVLSSLGIFILAFLAILLFALLPILIYLYTNNLDAGAIDTKSWRFYGSMSIGFLLVLLFPSKKKSKDYTDWSMLLHHIILDNLEISKALFRLDKKLFLKKEVTVNPNFVIVSGLARAGTTALTNKLFETNMFHSLSYANMPFLLSPQIWRKVYSPKKSKTKERAHGDNVQFGYDSVEALEEYFFKAFLNNSYISDTAIEEHQLSDQIYQNYLQYQQLVSKKSSNTTYLSKNNNLLLRYSSLRNHNVDFKVVLLFRDPINHALSLYNQHLRFTKMQSNDDFVLNYMNWLGHHEFGLNHKPFLFKELMCNQVHDISSLNYWLVIWINYYTKVLEITSDSNTVIVEYADFSNYPTKTISCLSEALSIPFPKIELAKYDPPQKEIPNVDAGLVTEANQIYESLKGYKLPIN